MQNLFKLLASSFGFTSAQGLTSTNVQDAIDEGFLKSLKKANNLSDLTNAATAYTNLGAAQSLAADSGWTKLPNGLIIQWQTFTAASQSFTAGTPYNFAITFPVTFNTVYHCVGSLANGANNSAVGVHFHTLTTSGVTARVNYSTTNTTIASFRVIALGI